LDFELISSCGASQGVVVREPVSHHDAPTDVRRWRWKPGALIAAMVVLLVAAPVGWWWRQQRAIEAALAAIAERGEPVTSADVDAMYVRPPHEQDCTSLWLYDEGVFSRKIFPAANVYTFFNQSIPPPRLDEVWEDLASIELFLSQIQSDLDAWHRAAARGGRARFSPQFERGFGTLLPYVQSIRWIGRCLDLDAHVRAYYGDAAGAADSLHAALMAARALENEPYLVSQLVRMVVHREALEEIRRLLPQVAFSAADLVRLQRELEATDFRAGVRRGLLGDRVAGIISAGDPSTMYYNSRLKLAVHYATQQQLLLKFLREMQAELDRAEKPWDELVAELPERTPAQRQPSAWSLDVSSEFSGGFKSGFWRTVAHATVANQITILALAIARNQLDHGQPPVELADLVPAYLDAVPLDAATDQSFAYTLDERGLALVSGWRDASAPVDPWTGADQDLEFRWPAAEQ
jgi:hypothetical protein